VALVAASFPAPAFAGGDGGGAAPERAAVNGGGGSYGSGVAPAEKRERARRRPRPRGALLTEFSLTRPNLFLYGRPARLSFRIEGRRPVPMRLQVLRASDRAVVGTLDLGERAPGAHELRFSGTELGVLPEDRYLLHLAGRGLRRAATASSTSELRFLHHQFPLAGAFDWGGEDARFGAARPGHSHQGQDLAATEGTPVLAPRAGVIEAVQYQARGAGHYVVLDGDDEENDYIFMHLRDGSIPVTPGRRVRTGQRIGEVGNTGRSFGAHLHFEIWVGGWYTGGAPIDPLPLLQAWFTQSRA
jgi:murein DD-endopeptidase MepM/ murein hydrolase activator NlpD